MGKARARLSALQARVGEARIVQEGMENQIGALGLVLNALVLFNTLYMDAALDRLRADGFDVRDQDVAASPRSSGTTSTC